MRADVARTEGILKLQSECPSSPLAIGGTGGAGAKQLTAFDGAAPTRAVVQVWDSVEKIQASRNDPQFKEQRQIGEKYGKFRSFAIEGVQ